MRRNVIFTKRWVKGSAVLVATAATLVFASPQQAIATPLKGGDSETLSQASSNDVENDFAPGIQGRITFLENRSFPLNLDPQSKISESDTPGSKTQPRQI